MASLSAAPGHVILNLFALSRCTRTSSPLAARDVHEELPSQFVSAPLVKSEIRSRLIAPPVIVALTVKTGLQVKLTAPVVASTSTSTFEAWPLTVHGEPCRAARFAGPAGP